jgi:glycosyltransferase involved in cell wall biosynthesis
MVLTPSEWSARMVARFFPEAEDRIRTVRLGVSPDFSPTTGSNDSKIRARLGLPADYLLYVGRRQLRKNVSGLVKSYARALEREPALPPLVLAGPSGENGQAWRTHIEDARLRDHVLILDDVTDTALPAIYRGAGLFLFPCRYEGFGLPVLEAMACGLPVIVADEGGLPELVADAGTRADPMDPEAWARAIVSLSRDAPRRQGLSARGLEIASRYSWRQTAEDTHAAYVAARQAATNY